VAEPTTRTDGPAASRDDDPPPVTSTSTPPVPPSTPHPDEPAPAAAPPVDPPAATAPRPAFTDGDLRPSAPRSAPGHARHRAARSPLLRRVRAGLLWPLAALVVVGLVAARILRGLPLPRDGALMAPAFLLSRGEGDLAPLSPEGLGAVHAAVYATVTRAVERHATLAAAERELLLVVLLVSAVLLWRTARGLGVPDAACAVGVLALGAVPALAPLHAVPTPAAFAGAWLLAAAVLLAGLVSGSWAPGGRPLVAVGVLAVIAVVLTVLLAPDALLLLVAGVVAAAAERAPRARWRALVAAVGVLLLAGTRALVGRWDPPVDGPSPWGADRTELLVVSGTLLVVGALTVWLLPALRAPGTALLALTLLAVAPPSGRVPALLLALPLGALLLGALAAVATARLARPVLVRRPRALLAAGLIAAVVLAGLGVAAAAGLAGTPRGDLGATAHAGLVGWAEEQLPDDAVVTAEPRLAAELLHAGADPAQVLSGGDGVPVPASTGSTTGLALRATTGRAPEGSATLTHFGDGTAGPVLTVVDPRPVQPTAEQETARRDLAAALLANPTTEVSAADTELLAAGQVDPRLLVLLAGIGAQYGVGIAALDPVPGEPDGALVRQAVIASVGGTPLTGDDAGAQAADRLRGWLDAQQDPYSPARVADVDSGLVIGYELARDPDALVTISRGR